MTSSPIAGEREALIALQAARRFIKNGVEFGYIRMPDADTPDPAHDTLPTIERAIAALLEPVGEGWVVVPKEPTEAMLRPFYECPPDELPLAWAAMLMVVAASPKSNGGN